MKRTILALAAFLVATATASAQFPGGVPARVGHASFNFDDAQISYAHVRGDFLPPSHGFTTVMLTFSKDGKQDGDHLSINLMVRNPGPVDLNQMGNGIGYWRNGAIISYVKGKSRCTLTVTKLTPTAVEGTAECPTIHENFGEGKHALTAVRFTASTQ